MFPMRSFLDAGLRPTDSSDLHGQPCRSPDVAAITTHPHGQLADLAVLAQDPFKADPSELAKIQVERTMAGGIWKYES